MSYTHGQHFGIVVSLLMRLTTLDLVSSKINTVDDLLLMMHKTSSIN